jgi:chromosome segregation protein
VLSDTGLGKEMHSVISQGRVESIVTSKPRDRRLLIEEAAGLGKHRKRRRRAQLKLERTQDNLDRALDVEREARSRLRPLKRQAEAAELHARLERQTLEARWELARDDLRGLLATLDQAQGEVARAREKREQLERELATVSKRRDEAEQALAARSAQREELSRRCFVAQSAGDRVAYRVEGARATETSVQTRLRRQQDALATLTAAADADAPDEQAAERIAALEQALAALDRDREAELARQLSALEQELGEAQTAVATRAAEVEQAAQARAESEAELERARQGVREAERAVEAARREAAGVGGELAAVNHFLRGQQTAPGGAPTLADELEVESGYELALAAALDGRLRAAVVSDRVAAARLLDQAGADGARALVTPAGGPDPGHDNGAQPPNDTAVRLIDRVRGPEPALTLARTLLAETWVVETIDSLADDFNGLAVTRDGRVWSACTRELRQAPAVGEERVLAERNRRQALVQESERAVQAEHQARAELSQAAERAAGADTACEQAIAAHRAAARARDEAAEVQRRIAAQIERRRAAPDDGPNAGRRAQLNAELAAERSTLERAERERRERNERIERLRRAIDSGEALQPAIAGVIEALVALTGALAERRATFEAALAADREAGEHVAAELRSCAQQEAALHGQLHAENETLTSLEVRAQRLRDQVAEAEHELGEVAQRLELAARPAEEPLAEDERAALTTRLERLARRREQLGPVNPLAQDEYAEALEHVEELERQRGDLETALRELEKLISDTDRQIRETFEETFEAAARNFEELSGQLFPGGRGRLRLVAERDGPARTLGAEPVNHDGAADAGAAPPGEGGEEAEDAEPEEDVLGVEIEITPAGKAMKRLSLLSGGEKSMTALAFLFAVFLAKPCPFYILDEVEAALDDLNIDRFLALLGQYSKRAQFIVVTHQKRTMEAADSLYGVSMGGDGISKVISRRLGPQELAA